MQNSEIGLVVVFEGRDYAAASIRKSEKKNLVIWRAPVKFDPELNHHEDHEDHEGNTELIDVPPSCT